MSEVTDLKCKLADLTDRLADVVIELSELKTELNKPEPRTKPWPQVGDEYWFLTDSGETCIAEYEGDWKDHYRLSTGNCHRTEAEALAYREWQTDPRVVARGMIERMEGFDPQGEYALVATTDPDEPVRIIKVGFLRGSYWNGMIRLASLGEAQRTLDVLGDPVCKVALGIITDKEEAGRIVREAMGR